MGGDRADQIPPMVRDPSAVTRLTCNFSDCNSEPQKMIAPNRPPSGNRQPINRSGLSTWTDEEYRAICLAAGSTSRAAFIRAELLDSAKLAELVQKYRDSIKRH